MKNSFYIDLQRFMLIPTKFPLSRYVRCCGAYTKKQGYTCVKCSPVIMTVNRLF